MYISDFRYHRPGSLAEAVDLLDRCSDGALIAGGTDLLVELKQRKRFHADVIALSHIEDLRSIDVLDGSLVIGATVTHNQLVHSPLVLQHCVAISEAAANIATEQIRNTGTVGGNLCTGASCADAAPILMVLDAHVELVGIRGQRTLPLTDFFVDHRRTLLQKSEIMRRIVVPAPASGSGVAFEKYGLRQAANISVASVAAMVRVVDGRCEAARFVVGAVAPTPKVCGNAAALAEGSPISELLEGSELVKQIAQAAAGDAQPLDDIRGSAEFRREIAATLARRALCRAVSRAGGRDVEGQGRR
jgi:CO/xanthine dehydrogenase FAD-binding subunit